MRVHLFASECRSIPSAGLGHPHRRLLSFQGVRADGTRQGRRDPRRSARGGGALPLGRLRWVSLPFSDYCPVLSSVRMSPSRTWSGPSRSTSALARLESSKSDPRLPAADGLYPVEVGYHHVLELPERSCGTAPSQELPTAPQSGREEGRVRSLAGPPRRTSRPSIGCRLSPDDGSACRSSRDAGSIWSRTACSQRTRLRCDRGSRRRARSSMPVPDPQRHNGGEVLGVGSCSRQTPEQAISSTGRSCLPHALRDITPTIWVGRTRARTGCACSRPEWAPRRRRSSTRTSLESRQATERGAWRRLPRRIIRRSPTWVCRGLGEAPLSLDGLRREPRRSPSGWDDLQPARRAPLRGRKGHALDTFHLPDRRGRTTPPPAR